MIRTISKQTITGIAAIGVASIILGSGIVMILQSDVAAHGDIIADKSIADVGEQITFYMVDIGTGQSMTTHFFIQFHDGTPTVELNNVFDITHQFPFEGTYTITMIAVSSYGLTDVSSTIVEIVNQQPAVDIVLPPGSIHEDDTISISVDPTMNATYPDSDTDKTSLNYMWRFGDGSTMAGNNVTKAFNQSGTYPVDVYVADDQGAVGYASENITILNVAPAADYAWTGNGLLVEDVNVLFDASLSSDTASDVESLRYFWEFGDGTHGRGKLLYHAFVSSGTFPVKLTVIDNDGEKDDMIKNIIVQNENPTSSPSTPFPALKEGDTGVYFANTNDTSSDLNQMEYQWDLGGNGSTLTHLWDDDFIGDVSSMATDPDGATSTSNQLVSIANTNPFIMVDSISMLGTITLSMAGTPNNTLFMRILQDGNEIGYTSLVKNASSTTPGQSRTSLDMNFDLSSEWEIEVFYGHLNQSTVTNVTGIPGLEDSYSNTTENYIISGPDVDGHGANPAWLTFNFIDGLSFTLFNVFWVWCNYSWSWKINPKDYHASSTLTLQGRILDRGQDLLSANITYGTEHVQVSGPGNDGFLNFSLNMHGWDNWENYWTTRWAQWWNNYDSFWSGYGDDFESWWTDWWMDHEDDDPYGFYISWLARFIHNNNWIDLIFNVLPWNNFYEKWYNNWNAWWESEWSGLEAGCWNDVVITAWDDDGGLASLTVTLSAINGSPVVDNLSPQVQVTVSGNPTEEGNVGFTASVVDFYNTSCMTNPDSLTYTWDFGDGNVTSGNSTITHSWAFAGDYMIQVSVSDGQHVGVFLEIITIQNLVPIIATISGQNNITEDQAVTFSVYNCIVDTSLDLASMHVTWEFDDGTFATGMNVTHFWVEDGFYNITVHVIDDNGAVASEILPIAVGEKLPVINGPFGIDVMQGTLASYALTFEDTVLDEQNLEFLWELGSITSTSPRFLKTLPPGLHNGTVTLTAFGNSNSTTANISIHVGNIIPTAIIQQQIFYAPLGAMNLTAYGSDSVTDLGALTFTWTLNGTFTPIPQMGDKSIVSWTPPHSGFYDCRVEVADTFGDQTETQFFVMVTLDDDGDGLSNEIEVDLGSDSSLADSDGDMLSDNYEANFTFTSPSNPDTDGDGLWDGFDPLTNMGEIYLGTDPRNNDTDGDGLLDGFEAITGWNISVQYQNGTMVNKTVWPDPLVVDTDGDRLTDYQEWQNGTDPRNPDTDGDGLGDFMESAYATLIDTDGDGISDVKENAGFDLRFANGTVLHVYSNMSVNDTDNDGLSDYEEWYPGGDGYVTNPWNNDTDGDGVLDSGEGFSKVQEHGQRKKIPAGTTGYFYFTANIGASVKNVTVTFGATTGEGTSADFHAVVKREGATVVDNTTNGQTYYFNASDVTEATGSRANGLWQLWITPSGGSDALLELFKVEAAVQLSPINPDTDGDGLSDGFEMLGTGGWITDPTLKDSDGDSWWDGYEINTRLTNPLDRDSDGDGVIDPSDSDPLRNVMIRVAVNSATWGDAYWLDIDLSNPELAVVTTVDGRAVATPKATTSSNVVTRAIIGYYWGVTDMHGSIWPWEWSYGWIPYTISQWNVARTASIGQFYFFDIPDDRKTVTLQSQLWHIWQGWPDVGAPIFTQPVSFSYTVGTTGSSQAINVQSGANSVSYTVSTIGLDKVNTIAVYENESTFVNDHYSSISQQNLVMLQISGTFTHGTFKPGLNVIVIPTEIFSNTKLHKVIELAVNSTTGAIDMSKLPSCLQSAYFSGIDRTRGTISRHVESLINATVDLNTAIAIINLVLTSAENETITGAFKAKRVASAATLGIAADVLALIPWDGSILDDQDDPGPMPRTLLGAIVSFFVAVATLLWGGIVAIANFFVQLVTLLVQWGMEAIGAFIAAIISSIETLVKALVLAFIYLMFALTLLFALVMFVAFIGIFSLLSLSSDPNDTTFIIDALSVELASPTLDLRFELEIVMIPVPWLDVSVPDVKMTLYVNDIIYFTRYLGIGAILEPEYDKLEEDAETIPEGDVSQAKSPISDQKVFSDSFYKGFISPTQSPVVEITPIGSPYMLRQDAGGNEIHIPTDYTNNATDVNSRLFFQTNITISDPVSLPALKVFLNITNGVENRGYSMLEEDATDTTFLDGKNFIVSVNFNEWALTADQRDTGLDLDYYYNVSYNNVVYPLATYQSIPFRLRVFENAPSIFVNPSFSSADIFGETHEQYTCEIFVLDLEGDVPNLEAESNKDTIYFRLYDNGTFDGNAGYESEHDDFTADSLVTPANIMSGVAYRQTITLPLGLSFWAVHYEDRVGSTIRDVYFMDSMSTGFIYSDTGDKLPRKLEIGRNIIWDWVSVDATMYSMLIPTVLMYLLITAGAVMSYSTGPFMGMLNPIYENIKKGLVVAGMITGVVGVVGFFIWALGYVFNQKSQEEQNTSAPSLFLAIALLSLTLSAMMRSRHSIKQEASIFLALKIVFFILGFTINLVPGETIYEHGISWAAIFFSLLGFDLLLDTFMMSNSFTSVVQDTLTTGYNFLQWIFLLIGILSITFTVVSTVSLQEDPL